MKPSIGCIVLVPIQPDSNNGSDVAPAIITRVWDEHPLHGWLVNVRVLCDGEATLWLTSVSLCDTEEQAREHGLAAFWPPRV